jgi:hypothetical protein
MLLTGGIAEDCSLMLPDEQFLRAEPSFAEQITQPCPFGPNFGSLPIYTILVQITTRLHA